MIQPTVRCGGALCARCAESVGRDCWHNCIVAGHLVSIRALRCVSVSFKCKIITISSMLCSASVSLRPHIPTFDMASTRLPHPMALVCLSSTKIPPETTTAIDRVWSAHFWFYHPLRLVLPLIDLCNFDPFVKGWYFSCSSTTRSRSAQSQNLNPGGIKKNCTIWLVPGPCV